MAHAGWKRPSDHRNNRSVPSLYPAANELLVR